MGRVLALALVLYGYGDDGFDGHRPASLDRPLREFHRAVDRAAIEAQRILVAIDSRANALPTLATLGDKLRRVGEALAPSSN